MDNQNTDRHSRRFLAILAAMLAPGAAFAGQFDIPAQDLAVALESFAKQADKEVLFDRDQTLGKRSVRVNGDLAPLEALKALIGRSGLTIRQVNERTFVVGTAKEKSSTGATAADQMRLAAGEPDTAPSSRQAEAPQDAQQMTVEALRDRTRPVAGGNLDLPRSENDPLPYQVFTHEDIARKGTIDLAEFLRQEVLSTDVSDILPGENQVGEGGNYWQTESGLSMRGFTSSETVVLVNGRRLPLTQYQSATAMGSPDLNAVPVNRIERIEVLPASASALYGDGALGGVINIVLRPDTASTQFRTTYNNATGGYDAPRMSYALSHGRTLLAGKMDVSFSATFTEVVPANESELGYGQAAAARRALINPPALTASVYGATPNIRSVNGSGLFGPGTSSVTSVAPGADGLGGLAAFSGREGVRNFDLFRLPGGASTLHSQGLDRQYGQNRQRAAYTGRLRYQPTDWLELAADLAMTVGKNYGGHRIYTSLQTVPANSPHNPFGQAVRVNVIEYAPRLGPGYYRSRSQTSSGSLGARLQFSDDWALALDYQRSRSQLKLRSAFWQTSQLAALMASGEYNPFRDSLAYGMPDVFYERVLTFVNGADGEAGEELNAPVVLNEYSTRLVNSRLPLPTGEGVLVLGGNYRHTEIESVTNVTRFGDGTLVSQHTLSPSYARARSDWGIYGELQLPLVPSHWLPRGLRGVHADLGYRYSGSDTFKRSPNPPTVALRLDLAGGFALRAAHTVAYRPPSSAQAVDLVEDREPTEPTITDPQRGNEQYTVQYLSSPNPDLLTEEGVTRTFGLIFERGKKHRLRASLDYVDTDKTNEITSFSTTLALDNEVWYPERVQREAVEAGDPYGVGRVTFIRGGPINVLGRRSKNWNASLSYLWSDFFGGAWQLRGRVFGYESYRTQLLPTAPVVENIENPDGSFSHLLKYRGTVGTSWSRGAFSAGLDGQYFHSRMLRRSLWDDQGAQRVDRYLKFDAYVQGDLSRFISGGLVSELQGQLRVDNVFNAKYPFNAGSTGDVSMYGDWRGQVYSVSLTATF